MSIHDSGSEFAEMFTSSRQASQTIHYPVTRPIDFKVTTKCIIWKQFSISIQIHRPVNMIQEKSQSHRQERSRRAVVHQADSRTIE